jgi:hypothetical protein
MLQGTARFFRTASPNSAYTDLAAVEVALSRPRFPKFLNHFLKFLRMPTTSRAEVRKDFDVQAARG